MLAEKALADKAGREVDGGRPKVAQDEVGELNVLLNHADEASPDESDSDGYVEFALVLGIDEPVDDFFLDLGEELTQPLEDEHKDLAAEG